MNRNTNPVTEIKIISLTSGPTIKATIKLSIILRAFLAEKFVLFRYDRSVEASKKTKGDGVMLLVLIKVNLKLRQDLKVLRKKYDSLWIVLKTASDKMKEPPF